MRALKQVRQHFDSYHLKSGVFHFYRGEHGPAAEYLTRVLTEETDVSASDRRAAMYYLVQTRIGAAQEFEAADEHERAIEEYRRAIDVIPSYPDVQFKLGAALRRRGLQEEAVEHFRRALESNPLYVDSLVALGFTLFDLGRHDDARNTLAKALSARVETLTRKVRAAEAALSGGRADVAIEIYHDAFESDPGAFRDALQRGLDHLRAENWEDAIETLGTAADLCPRFADVHNYLGVALAESGLHEEAMISFRRSVEINPAYAVAWLNLAYTAHALGDLRVAREALEPVLSREPDNGPARYLAAQIDSARRAGSQAALDGR